MKGEKKRGNRILGGCILLLMLSLALTTAVMAASNQWKPDGSYSLVIYKQFAEGTPDDVLAEAQKQSYRFHIEGYRLDSSKNEVPINQDVTIGPKQNTEDIEATDVWQSETFYSDGPIYVSVTEITNNITLKVEGENGEEKEYNMGDSRAETSTRFEESSLVRDLNNNGKIVLSRPLKKIITENGEEKEVNVTTTSSFRITSSWPWDENEVAKPTNWTEYENIVKLVPGDPPKELTGLQAGRYTIEDLSVSGYNLTLGHRNITVAPNEKGTFYINSKPGKLVIIAGGTKNDGLVHYFTIKRVNAPSDAEKFEDRVTEGVKSQEQFTVDNLPRGQYEVTEYTFSDVPTEFKVEVSKVETKDCTAKLESVEKDGVQTFKTTDKAKAHYVNAKVDKDVTYITNLRFGPLRNSEGKVLANKYKYSFGLRYRSITDPTKYSTSSYSNVAANTKEKIFKSDSWTPNYLFYPRASGVFSVAVWNMTANTGRTVDLSWTENKEISKTYTHKEANKDYSCTVDDWNEQNIDGMAPGGWIKITAPAVDATKPGAQDITYTYTIINNDGVTRTKTRLEPGAAYTFENLSAGSYLVRETVNQRDPVGFTMDVSGDPFGSNEAGKAFDLTVMGERTLTITKPALEENQTDGDRDYTFRVEKISGDAAFEARTVTLKAGETNDETHQSITLPKGTYKVTPVDDKTEVFELICSDSSQVKAEVPSGSSASVTFTNVFNEGTLGYRYVHEYYIFDPDTGKYTYEGNSPITTVGGRPSADEFYGSIDVAKEPDFTIGGKTYTYDYMPDHNGYGRVVTDAHVETADSKGLRLRNRAFEKDKVTGKEEDMIRYQVDDTLMEQKHIGVDAEKSQIIILRYFRVLPENQQGSYKYIHVYYFRDSGGDHWEGSSEIKTKTGQLGMPYSANNIGVEPNFTAQCEQHKGQTFTYTYNNRPSYGTLSTDHSDPLVELYRIVDQTETTHKHYRPDSDADHIVATADGQQIIILRYYREVK